MPGTEVEAKILRDGDELTLTLEVGGLDADEQPSVAGISDTQSDEGPLGLVTENADADMMTELGLTGGVVVLEVVPESPAAVAGIMGGDVITRLGKSVIQSTRDMRDAVDRLQPGQSVAIRLIRRGAPLFLAVRVPEA